MSEVLQPLPLASVSHRQFTELLATPLVHSRFMRPRGRAGPPKEFVGPVNGDPVDGPAACDLANAPGTPHAPRLSYR